MEKFPLPHIEKDETLMSLPDDRSRLHEAILNAADRAIISLDPNAVIISFNKSAENLLGYKAIELVGKVTPEILIDKNETDAQLHAQHNGQLFTETGFIRILQTAREKRDTCQIEATYVHKNGRRIPAMIAVSPLWERNVLMGYVITSHEINEWRKEDLQQREIQNQLQAIIASIDDIVFEVDHTGRFTQVWVKSDDYLFLPREQILGKTLAEMFGQEFAEPFENGLKAVLETSETFQWEYPSMKPGDNRWFCAKCSMVFENGRPTRRVTVCIQNITERKNIELSLRQSEEKFRLLAESIPGVVFMMSNDQAKSMLYVNNKIEDVTGYAVGEFYSGNVQLIDLIHEDDRVYVGSVRSKSIDDKLSYNLEYRILHKTGVWRWVSETGIGVHSEGGVMLEGFIADVTQRKESEEELRRMADENSRVFNNSIILTSIAGFDGFYKKLNPAWEKTLGWSRDELLTKPIHSFIHPDDIAKTEEVLRIIVTGHTVTMFENRYRCKDGTYRWLLWGSSPDIAKKIIYASAIDITSRKKFEEELIISKRNLEVAAYELEEQNRQLDEFAHIISHNLRAPVANIKALLSFITETSQPGDYQLIFEKIKNVTHNIGETMNELMEMIKIRKTHEIDRVEIRFKDLLDKVVQSLEGELIEAGATVTYNFNNAPKIYYAKPYLESILQNLISNAVKYRSPKRIPEIFVSTDLVISGIELRVQDNGLGIDLEKYGDKLFGLHKTFHENKEARGVGLFLTKTQIETLGGNIRAESKVDEGTTFIIQF